MTSLKKRIFYFMICGFLLLRGSVRLEACEVSEGEHFSAATLPAGETELGFSFEYRKWDEMGHMNAHLLHEAGEHIHNFNHDEFYRFSLARGVTDRLEVELMMPVVAKTFLRVEDGVVGHGDASSGAGDLQTHAKIKFLDSPFEAALLGGVKLPTGETSSTGFDGKKLEIEEVPGTGSFDYMLGAAFGFPCCGRARLDAAFLYHFRTPGARDYEFGDEADISVSASYALGDGKQPRVRLTAGLLARLIEKDRSSGMKAVHSGGQILTFAPGVAVEFGDGVSASLSVPVPVYQDRGGEHPEIDFGVVAGLRWRV